MTAQWRLLLFCSTLAEVNRYLLLRLPTGMPRGGTLARPQRGEADRGEYIAKLPVLLRHQ
jgi:hypothetical protein